MGQPFSLPTVTGDHVDLYLQPFSTTPSPIPLCQPLAPGGIPLIPASHFSQGARQAIFPLPSVLQSSLLVLSPALQHTTCCGHTFLPVPILRALHKSWWYTQLFSLLCTLSAAPLLAHTYSLVLAPSPQKHFFYLGCPVVTLIRNPEEFLTHRTLLRTREGKRN